MVKTTTIAFYNKIWYDNYGDNMDYNKNTDDIITELNSSLNGLSNKEAKNRLNTYGKNVLPTKKRDSILKMLSLYVLRK